MTQKSRGGAIAALLAELAAIDLANTKQAKPRKLEEGETIIGKLSDDLLRHWLLRDHYRAIVKDIVDRITDLGTVHLREHAEEKTTEAGCRKYREKLDALNNELRIPGLKFRILDEVFWKMAELEFPEETNKAIVLGVRNGDTLISRNNDNRGDQENIFAETEIVISGSFHGSLLEVILNSIRRDREKQSDATASGNSASAPASAPA